MKCPTLPRTLNTARHARSARVSLQNIPNDLQSLRLIDFHLLFWRAQERLLAVLGALTPMFKTSAQLRLENLALRQQLTVLRRSAPKRLKLTAADRIFWVWLRRVWGDWKSALMIVKAETVIAWHREGFRLFLDVANPPWHGGSPQGAARDSRSDSDAEPQQPALGCTTHSWRIAEARYRDHQPPKKPAPFVHHSPARVAVC